MHQRPLDTPFRRVEEGRFQKGEIDKAGIFGATASFGETFTLDIGSPNSQVMQGERERVGLINKSRGGSAVDDRQHNGTRGKLRTLLGDATGEGDEALLPKEIQIRRFLRIAFVRRQKQADKREHVVPQSKARRIGPVGASRLAKPDEFLDPSRFIFKEQRELRLGNAKGFHQGEASVLDDTGIQGTTLGTR